MRYSVKRKLNIDVSPQECDICGQICRGPKALKSHKTQKHVYKKRSIPRGRPIGLPAWNKGLSKKKDNRNPEFIGKRGGYRPNAGRSKKFKVLDSFGNIVTLQSTYELNLSEILFDLGIEWVRPKALKYDNKNYYADFYLPIYDIWLDPKNSYKAKQDVEKIEKVIKQNNVKLLVLLEYQITREYIASLVK
jgi:hypothetical protein